jgi:cytochrome c
MKLILPVSVMLVALGACDAAPPADQEATLIAEGRSVAEAQCARCHALDGQATSPNPAAPAMNDLLGRYSAEMLASDLIEGIRIGHDEMPEFDFAVTEADALVAYLTSIRQR